MHCDAATMKVGTQRAWPDGQFVAGTFPQPCTSAERRQSRAGILCAWLGSWFEQLGVEQKKGREPGS